jgi:heme/copper-type cytochrome/quinol oxidase subunit 3
MGCKYNSLLMGMSIAILLQCTIGSSYRNIKKPDSRGIAILLGAISLLISSSIYAAKLLLRSEISKNLYVFLALGIYLGYFFVSASSALRYSKQMDKNWKQFGAITLCLGSLAMSFGDWVLLSRAIAASNGPIRYPIGFVNLLALGQFLLTAYQTIKKLEKTTEFTETVVGSYILASLIALIWQFQYFLYILVENDHSYYLPSVFLMLSTILLLENSAVSVLQKINKYERNQTQLKSSVGYQSKSHVAVNQ